jgi:hypothetical protein
MTAGRVRDPDGTETMVDVVSGHLTGGNDCSYAVSMSDTSDAQWIAERDAVPSLLDANRVRRDAADAERRAAREELRELVVRGYRVALTVAEMARRANVSRETVHVLLREAGQETWSERSERRQAPGQFVPWKEKESDAE